MKIHQLILSLIFLLTSINPVMSQSNLGFESGLASWKVNGKIALDNTNAIEGKNCVKIGQGYGAVSQRADISQFELVKFGAKIKVSDSTNLVNLYMKFYDKDSVLLLNAKSKSSANKEYSKSVLYFEAPAKAKYFEYGIESDSKNTGFAYADSVTNLNISKDPVNTPQCNLSQYMRPFWSSDTVYSEAVLMYLANGANITSGKLFYPSKKVISVTSYDQKTTYEEGVDYGVVGNEISSFPNSKIPFKKQSELVSTNLNWNNIQSQWVNVTYIPDRTHARIHYFDYKADMLPNTYEKLKNKKPVRIMALGMSITRGYDMSGYNNIAPYMPNYVTLFANQLKKAFGYNDITEFNAGFPGAASGWLASYADKYVNPIKPDLVILDMGMNDFWGLSPQGFKANVQMAMNKIKTGCPDVEFMLISNMLFDPEYVTDSNASTYLERMKGYNTALQSLEDDGVVDVDMTTMSDTIYHRKKAKDCIANPLHPNDYMGRWYAQGMVAVFDSVVVKPSVNYCSDFKAVYDKATNSVTFSGLNNGGKIWIANTLDNWKTFEEITPKLTEGQDVAVVKLKGKVGLITMIGMNQKGLNKCTKNFNFLADPKIAYTGCSNFKATYDEKSSTLTVSGLNNGGTNWIGYTSDNWKSYKEITPSLAKGQDVAKILINPPVGIVSMWTRDVNGENTCNTDIDFSTGNAVTKFSDVMEYSSPVKINEVVNLKGEYGDKTSVSILDLQGKEVVKSFKPKILKNSIEIDLNRFNVLPGVYLVRAQSGKLYSITKLVVKP
jgi:lysophospholipase L1-like esterase